MFKRIHILSSGLLRAYLLLFSDKMTTLCLLFISVSIALITAETAVYFREQFEDGGNVFGFILHYSKLARFDNLDCVSRFFFLNNLFQVKRLFLNKSCQSRGYATDGYLSC